MRKGRLGVLELIDRNVDMLLNLLSTLLAYFSASSFNSGIAMQKDGVFLSLNEVWTVAIITANVTLASFVFTLSGLYDGAGYRGRFSSLSAPFRANAIYYGFVALVILLTASGQLTVFLLWWALLSAVICTVFLALKRKIVRGIQRFFFKNRAAVRRIIIVGDNFDVAREYIRQSEGDIERGDRIVGYVGYKESGGLGAPRLGSFSEFSTVLERYKPTDAVFAIDSYDKARLIGLVNMCDDRCVRVFFLPVTYGFFKTPRQIEEVGTLPVINLHTTPLDNFAGAFLKRLIDIASSLVLIILTSPIMLFAAIGVKLSSAGPVIFRQVRVGRMGKNFVMLKFRSMRVNNLSDSAWTTDADPRKTRFGNFIRKTAIDELPQLFNVLVGEMSLVGPRPEIPEFVERFKNDIPLYMIKHYVKPGMTGLAQIKGLRGDTSVEDRIREDLDYIENWTPWLDLYIIIRTPFALINKNERYIKEEIKGPILDDETTRG